MKTVLSTTNILGLKFDVRISFNCLFWTLDNCSSQFPQLARPGEMVSLSYAGLEDPAVRDGCESGWMRMTELKCCRLERRALSWQVGRDTSPSF